MYTLCMYEISAEIIRPPSDVTVFLGESAVFECEVDSDFSGWRVNGTPLNRLEPEFRNDLMTPDPLNTEEGNGIIQLIIPGRAEYNGTIVQCVIPGSQESENVTMNVQGKILDSHQVLHRGGPPLSHPRLKISEEF